MTPSRLAAWPFLFLVAATGGCATRQEAPVAGGGRDARRDEIARLDRRIADEEVQLGVRRAEPALTADAEAGQAAGGEEIAQSQPEAPPSMQPAPPSPAPEQIPGQASPPGMRFSSPPPEADSCARVCRSVAAICQASSRICRLADGLDDAWADGRCEAATRSCATAEQRAESRCAGSCR